jgi:hypothetical protein
MGKSKLALVLGSLIALVVACSSADDPKSQCMDGCARSAKACSGFDRSSCESTCNGASTTTPSGVPEKCKSQAEAYGSCAKSAKISCPDGKTPQITGCESQENALFDCVQEN